MGTSITLNLAIIMATAISNFSNALTVTDHSNVSLGDDSYIESWAIQYTEEAMESFNFLDQVDQTFLEYMDIQLSEYNKITPDCHTLIYKNPSSGHTITIQASDKGFYVIESTALS